MQISVHLIVCWAVLLLGAIAIIFNWLGFLSAQKAKRGYSFMPASLFAIFASIAIALYPGRSAAAYFWVPLVIDPGLGFFLVAWAIQSVLRRNRAHKTNSSQSGKQ
jgi:hypothetical protein